MKLLKHYLAPVRRFMTMGLTVKMLSTLVELVIPYILSHIIDTVVPTASVPAILLWGFMMILCAAAALQHWTFPTLPADVWSFSLSIRSPRGTVRQATCW